MPESNDNIVVTATDDEQIDLASATNGDDEYFARLEVLDPNSRQHHEELEAAARQHAASQDPYRQALERHQQALPQLIPLYESARAAVAEARTIDEARKIRDVVDALRAYARQANDAEIETMIAEIKLRARRRIGELSHGLEKGGGPGRGKRLPSAEKSFKTAKLKAAGISSSVANRCEKLASIAEEEFERHIARARERHQSVRIEDLLRTVVKGRKIDATVRSGPWRDRLENVFGWDPTAGKPKPGVHLYKLTRKYLQTPVDKVMHALAVKADVADPKWQRLLQLEQEQCEALMQKLSDLRPEQREEFLQDLSTAGEDDLVLTLDYVEVTREAEDHSDA